MLNKKRKYPKKEGAFVKAFMKEVDAQCDRRDIWWCKVHGEPMQRRGIPDIMICYKGVFVAAEFKIMRGGTLKVTPYQQDTLETVAKAKGISYVIFWDETTANVGINTEQFEGKDAVKKAVTYFLKHVDDMKASITCYDLIHGIQEKILQETDYVNQELYKS